MRNNLPDENSQNARKTQSDMLKCGNVLLEGENHIPLSGKKMSCKIKKKLEILIRKLSYLLIHHVLLIHERLLYSKFWRSKALEKISSYIETFRSHAFHTQRHL